MDVTKGDVDALAREGKNVVEKRKWAVREEHLARKRIEDAENRTFARLDSMPNSQADLLGISRLERIQECVSAIAAVSDDRKPGSSSDILGGLTESFTSLLSFKEEYRTMALDEVVVGAIAQTVSWTCAPNIKKLNLQTKQSFADWDPLDISSDSLLLALKRWRHAYNLPRSDTDDSGTLVTSTQAANGAGLAHTERVMTPWESLLWSLWLPRVRSSIK